ncbi:HD domain-containing protein [Curvivirga aplysinae]|uniref:HD domain-containing protein n=1 Tax=Curvivirga aplysinae TaxID=2529852 RepID=UPI0012BB6EFF|nr:HD domain-containing protein [Curvivirga aplysinae]MTI09959.1 phosphodiesterase [Curvivirga aplysinae]
MQDHKTVTKENVVDFLIDMFNSRGQDEYLGEAITQSEHMLQCAVVADQFEAKESVILASLLHDVGHFMHDYDFDCADHGIDSRHEDVADDFLKKFYPPEVTEPVRMHVDAKRYLCAVEPDYFGKLSEASVHSLKLQGGPMSAEEVKKFEESPHLKDALDLRRFEEAGKVDGVATPKIEEYRDLMLKFLIN